MWEPPKTTRSQAASQPWTTSPRRRCTTSRIRSSCGRHTHGGGRSDRFSRKRQGSQGYLSKHTKSLADWQHKHVFRLNNEEPDYDTLTPMEFVGGYLSIMEERIPQIPENARLLKHLLPTVLPLNIRPP